MMLILNEMLNHTKSRLTGVVVRTFGTSQWLSASHYDVLEVTPKATQSDIKSAYYKLSKLYHPDKSSDEESAKKFRAITEAYEVLGNVKLKKMYDKGLLVGDINKSRMGSEYKVEPEPKDPTLKFYRSRGKKNITPTYEGRTSIYDFDEWAKNHYGDLLKKSKSDKEHIRRRQATQAGYKEAMNQELMLLFIAFTTITLLYAASYSKSEYDLDTTTKTPATHATKQTNSGLKNTTDS